MNRPLRIVDVDTSLGRAWSVAGHEVFTLSAQAGEVDVAAELERNGFEPDLLVQRERLGPRLLLSGLEKLPCRKVFWSVDTHLNAHWHCWYGRLFDKVYTTQFSWVERLRAMGPANVEAMPHYGKFATIQPWRKRRRTMAFVGRLSEHRKLRSAMVELLSERFDFQLYQDIPGDRIQEAYGSAWLVPNEAIIGEINFRLFEGSASACLVLQPAYDNGLERLFTPGKEVAVYNDAADLIRQAERYFAHPEEAEAMGLAARAAVLERHLPAHRAERVIALAEDDFAALPQASAVGTPAVFSRLMTHYRMMGMGMSVMSPRRILVQLLPMQQNAKAAAACIDLMTSLEPEQAKALLGKTMHSDFHAPCLEFNAMASTAAARLGLFDAAADYWQRYQRHGCDVSEACRPENMVDLLLLWSEAFERRGLDYRPGFAFDEERDLPESALECLLTARHLQPDDERVGRRIADLCRDLPGAEYLRLGVLSHLSCLHRREWRIGLDLALLNLRAYRLRQGMEELSAARTAAEAQGEENAFAVEAESLMGRLPADSAAKWK